MSGSTTIMGPECKAASIAKVYTIHNVKIRPILSKAGDTAVRLAFTELSSGLFFVYTYQGTERGTIGLRITGITHDRL